MSDNSLVPYSDLERMAAQVVKGGLFPGIKTTEQALTLFLVAQSEGLHPMTATMRYNIIQNRPAMKAEAMLASFMERGGTVDWTEYTDEAVTGIFRSAGVPKGVSVRWTLDDAAKAGLGRNPTWKSYPKQMLKARVASDGVRMCDPAVNQGRYTPEEVSEFREVEIVSPEPPEASLGPLLEASIAQIQIRKEAEASVALDGDTQYEPVDEASAFADERPGIFDPLGKPLPFEEDLARFKAGNAHKCEECGFEVKNFTTSKGAKFRQCSQANMLYWQAMKAGEDKKDAAKLSRKHYYQVIP